ncbi:MAG TPA: sigma 54-interacting transcriptional regulator [Syntrophales bacterium]|nr:sigma 54-interacting transcriptional regulator [Syntrophales bacterium]HPQ45641.1 sigma 54-interacting transcriptional regulator [Syntrophales bacterium]
MMKIDFKEDSDFQNNDDMIKKGWHDFPLALVIFDRDGYLIYANGKARSFFHLKKESTPERLHCSQLDKESSEQILNLLLTGKTQTHIYTKINQVAVVCDRVPIRWGKKVVGVVVSYDTTMDHEDFKRDKNLLKPVEAVIESSYDGIYITDGEANTLMVNSAYEKMTGINRSYVIGRNMRDLVREGYFNESVTLKVLETRERQSLKQKLWSGKELLVTGNPVFDEEGNIIMVVTNDRDMTELIHLQQQVEDSLEMALAYKEKLKTIQQSVSFGKDFIAVSKSMQNICDLVSRVSKTDATVLFAGETGVGKDRLAEEVHTMSPRFNKGLFVKINCGAIPETLLESELFGYERGAFTGARKEGKIGLFEVADGGTIFLDEVESLPMSLQPKLLRVLQDLEITRVGGTVSKKVDVRIICATNLDLKEMVAENRFRADLYYRLNVVAIEIPPLRERKDDIPYLITFFVNYFNDKYNKKRVIDNKAMNALLTYPWPGNVREIANVIERLVVVSLHDRITPQDIPDEIQVSAVKAMNIAPGVTLKKHIERIETVIIKDAIKAHGSARKAATALGLDHSTITRKLKRCDQL